MVTSKQHFYYELKENSIKICTEFCEFEVDYKDIYKITPRASFYDKLTKRGEQTLTIYANQKYNKKFSLYFIKENALDLVNEILEHKNNEHERK